MKASRSSFIPVRGLQVHLRHWGDDKAPILMMLHGWMDVSASFQFVVDSLRQDWHVIAPDWRGFGLTRHPGTDTYWFPDYLADLDAILDHCQPDAPLRIIGHSMGGNIACMYAGIRPHRVARLVNLEGFGMPSTRPEQAPERYARWMDELKHPATLGCYDSLEGVEVRLRKNNPRLTVERARFLAQHWAAQQGDGTWHILGDPAHKRTHPILYRAEEALACWRRIEAPVLWVEAADTNLWKGFGNREAARAELARRMAHIPDVTREVIADAGHMLQHDQPDQVARLIERHCPYAD